MHIEIRKSAIKDLKSIPAREQARLHERISGLSAFPQIANIKKLTNFEPAYRMRVGEYRVLFDVIDDTVFIARVLHRRDSYK